MADGTKGVHWAIKLLVAWHAFAIFSWSLPEAPPAVINGSRSPGIAYAPLYVNDVYIRGVSPDTGLRPFQSLVEYDELGYVEGNDWARYTLLELYMIPTGFWQGWDMFAPNPADTDVWVDAIVTFEDGSTERVRYPRMKELDVFSKYIKERYRKYRENLSDDKHAWKWPAFARRIAWMAYDDPDNPPVHVALRRHWMQVQPPGEPQWQEYQTYVFFEYDVDQGWLRDNKRP